MANQINCDNINYIEEEHEYTKKQADFIVEEKELAYDVTIRHPNELEAAYKHKKKKYKRIYYGKEVAPIVMSWCFTIHQKSLKSLLELNKFNALIPQLASRLVKGHV
jgi:hypothetical protein